MSDPVTDVSRDLGEILRLCNDLEAQAVRSTDRDMPGGTALVELGPVANLEAWGNQYDALETAYYAAKDAGRPATWPDLSHENDADQPVLQTLLYWTETLRVEHGEDWDHKVTIASEAHYLRRRLDWVWAHEPRFEDMAKDVRSARVSLENVLKAGHRDQPTRVYCDADACTKRPRLIVIRMPDEHDDFYKCPACKMRYDHDQFDRTYRRQLRSGGAERFILKADAVLTLAAQGTPDRVARRWFDTDKANDVIESYCEMGTHRTFLWWPSVWRRHLAWQNERRMRRVS